RFFPLSLGSEGSCQIGGNLATNAGGLNVLRYGMTRDLVLGLEVVLADGRVLDALQALRKDNTGYDVKSLFIGAEGSLGIITAATLKLFPRPRSYATAFIAVASPADAVRLLARLRAGSGDQVASFELIPRVAVELTQRHIEGVAAPLDDPSPWYVLAELTSTRNADPLAESLADLLATAAAENEITNAVIAQNEGQRAAFWRLRESIPAAQRRAGASLKHDVSVPIAALPDFVATASGWVAQHVPAGYLVAYGHIGDGNLHFNINANDAGSALLTCEPEIKRAIHDFVQQFGGSFSAEHGIGQLKVAELERYADPVELEVMRSLKQALDPHGILNPGKVLRA
ncbi:MAG TPA: FAD-binding oxidoreductase, partial [Steroidobacteraceae bacterium]|nr:FAD-binding oxidoreductase [Steroidobacteraceae bacterium]